MISRGHSKLPCFPRWPLHSSWALATLEGHCQVPLVQESFSCCLGSSTLPVWHCLLPVWALSCLSHLTRNPSKSSHASWPHTLLRLPHRTTIPLAITFLTSSFFLGSRHPILSVPSRGYSYPARILHLVLSYALWQTPSTPLRTQTLTPPLAHRTYPHADTSLIQSNWLWDGIVHSEEAW